MLLAPGKLVKAKVKFSASIIPYDYEDQQKISINLRKTLKNIIINQNDTLMIIKEYESEAIYSPGWTSHVTIKKIMFLLGEKLCIATSTLKWDEYLAGI